MRVRRSTLSDTLSAMELFFWVMVFAAALVVMVRGADLFLKYAEVIGVSFGLSSFVIGAMIVGFGTSLPELTTSLIGVLRGVPEVVAANAIGSNIANILLIGGVLAYLGKKVAIDKDLLDAELPFFVISTALFAMIAVDGDVTRSEALLLASTFAVYVLYLLSEEYDSGMMVEKLEKEVQRGRKHWLHRLDYRSIGLLLAGLAALITGAKFVIEAVVHLAQMLEVSPGLISITAIAIGTSLPELVVSVQALRTKKLTVAIGNIFGSNAFNILMAIGLPGLIVTLPFDRATYEVGLPMLLATSFIFLVIGLARRLYRWEGIMFFILYGFFMLQLAEVLR